MNATVFASVLRSVLIALGTLVAAKVGLSTDQWATGVDTIVTVASALIAGGAALWGIWNARTKTTTDPVVAKVTGQPVPPVVTKTDVPAQ